MKESFKMKEFICKLVKQEKIKLVEPSYEVRESYVKKFENSFNSAKLLLDNGLLEEAVILIYYSMYNLLNRLLFNVGIKSENHTASIFLLDYLFEFDNSLIKLAKKERIKKQYYTGFKTIFEDVVRAIDNAEDFNYRLLNFILKLNNESIDSYRQKFKEVLGFN